LIPRRSNFKSRNSTFIYFYCLMLLVLLLLINHLIEAVMKTDIGS
jgi:hypothetical protein